MGDHRHCRISFACWAIAALRNDLLLRPRPGADRDAGRQSAGRTGLDRCVDREKCVNSAIQARNREKEGGAIAAELTLFGGFELRLAGGETVDLPGQKDRALLAVLALRPGATQSRDKLAGLLWSERGDAQARDSLKHALTRLRQCFAAGPPPFVADRRSVTLDPAALATDVVRFEQLMGDGTDDALEQATTLYRGDLLDGIAVHDPSFEEWLSSERQRLRQAVEDGLTRLMERSLAAGASERAAAAARRLLSLDPLRETACRTLMQIDAERSQTAQALRLFETLRDRLHRELGVKPEPATQQLYESIRRRAAAPVADPEPAEAPAAAEPPLPSRPSIAVLPFVNLSGDPEQEYFADGMVEEIITALSRMRWLMVIARNSSFIYRGRAVDVKQIGRELGVRYVLEGSVRKAGERVRIAGQLIDAASGAHLWADRFEGGLEDVFDLQDQVTTSVISAIAPRLEQAEIERARRKPPASLDAYDYFLRGMARFTNGPGRPMRKPCRCSFGQPSSTPASRRPMAWARAAIPSARAPAGRPTLVARSPTPSGWPGAPASSARTMPWRCRGRALRWPSWLATSRAGPFSPTGQSTSTPIWPGAGCSAAWSRSGSASPRWRWSGSGAPCGSARTTRTSATCRAAPPGRTSWPAAMTRRCPGRRPRCASSRT
jgi:TolB-like protein/two-component SAPR family response regulator